MCERKLAIHSCPTLCDSIDCSLADSSVHGNLKVRILEWVPISFSRGSSWPRDGTQGSRTTGRFFTIWAPREVWKICRSAKWARGGLWQIQRCPVDQAGKCFLEFRSWYSHLWWAMGGILMWRLECGSEAMIILLFALRRAGQALCGTHVLKHVHTHTLAHTPTRTHICIHTHTHTRTRTHLAVCLLAHLVGVGRQPGQQLLFGFVPTELICFPWPTS